MLYKEIIKYKKQGNKNLRDFFPPNKPVCLVTPRIKIRTGIFYSHSFIGLDFFSLPWADCKA